MSIELVRAPNPSAMTLTGTNTYIVSSGAEAIVLDPGPPLTVHVEALLERIHARALRVVAIGLTHGHPDHAPAAALLARETGAPIYAHPKSLVAHDVDFALEAIWDIGSTALHVIDAPGHTFDHVIFYEPVERALFTGDVILGEGTVVIAPPGGSMRPYQATLARLRDEFPEARRIYGGHGPVVADAQAKIAEYIRHRRKREAELVEALNAGAQTIPELVIAIYGPARNALWPAMGRQMLAYLEALTAEGRVCAEPVARAMNAQETAILNPSWESLVGDEHAEVIKAELGAMHVLERLYRYRLNS
ncbi:MAG: MBL fold metallo-hydrolase [Candidatus Eremiobacteraeota bacterium]|nr:MBL fold metallo-hydrolase [Candidatus Eremiobacteraeota bacterium]